MSENNNFIEVPTLKIKNFHITDYITKSLNKVAEVEGFKNFHLDIDYGSKIGDGFLGVILKVKIIEGEKILSVLAKVPPENKARREVLRSMDFFAREVYMYNVVLPEFVKFQKENEITESEGFYNIAKIYLAECNDDDSIIIMEDLRDINFKNWNKFKPIDYDHASLIMATLGKFHAISIAMKLQKPELFKKISTMKEIFYTFRNEKSVERLQKMIQKLVEVAPQNDQIHRIYDNIKNEVLMCVDFEAAEPFSCITHGDCWTNNFLFHYDKNGHPDDIVLIDWQASRYSSPVLDLVYFLFISSDKELRGKYYDQLMDVYHQAFINLCTYMGVDKIFEFSYNNLQDQLKFFGKYGVIMSSFVVPLTQAHVEDIPDFDKISEEIQQENEKEEAKSVFVYKTKNKIIDNRIRDIIDDSAAYGYL